jgi:hypothetical protein
MGYSETSKAYCIWDVDHKITKSRDVIFNEQPVPNPTSNGTGRQIEDLPANLVPLGSITEDNLVPPPAPVVEVDIPQRSPDISSGSFVHGQQLSDSSDKSHCADVDPTGLLLQRETIPPFCLNNISRPHK